MAIQAAPALQAPDDRLDLPVLTALVEDAVPPEEVAPAAQPLKARRPYRRTISLVIVGIALMAVAASLRWFAPVPAPVAVVDPLPATAAPPDKAPVAPPLTVSAPSGVSEGADLSFSPVEVAPEPVAPVRPARAMPRSEVAPAPRAVGAAPRPAPKPREIRETISPPPAACTSNMAALGFCTLPPTSAKE